MSDAEAQRVIEAVRKHIQDQHPGGVTLEVVPEGVRRDHEWWYVPVKPSKQPPKRYEYYEALAGVEHDVQREENLTVLLLPAPPDQQVAA